jgi:hypothetical protein
MTTTTEIPLKLHYLFSSKTEHFFLDFPWHFIALIAIFSQSLHLYDFPILGSLLYWLKIQVRSKLGVSQKLGEEVVEKIVYFAEHDGTRIRITIFIILSITTPENNLQLVIYIHDSINLNII